MRRRNPRASAATFPLTLWWDLATRSSQMMTASAEVIVRRSSQLGGMSHPPSASDRKEMLGMVSEKVAASQQSATAMLASASSAASQFWMDQWLACAGLGTRKAPTVAEAMATASAASARMLSAGMQPYRQRAISNAKRLRKRQPKA